MWLLICLASCFLWGFILSHITYLHTYLQCYTASKSSYIYYSRGWYCATSEVLLVLLCSFGSGSIQKSALKLGMKYSFFCNSHVPFTTSLRCSPVSFRTLLLSLVFRSVVLRRVHTSPKDGIADRDFPIPGVNNFGYTRHFPFWEHEMTRKYYLPIRHLK